MVADELSESQEENGKEGEGREREEENRRKRGEEECGGQRHGWMDSQSE